MISNGKTFRIYRNNNLENYWRSSNMAIPSFLAKCEAQAEKVAKGEEFPAHIRSVEESTAGEVFSGKNDDKPVKNPERAVCVLEVEIDDGEKFTQVYSLPKTAGSWKNENFKLGHFRERYGTVPYEGLSVMVTVDKDGYYSIAT
jgi:hypothetical protein